MKTVNKKVLYLIFVLFFSYFTTLSQAEKNTINDFQYLEEVCEPEYWIKFLNSCCDSSNILYFKELNETEVKYYLPGSITKISKYGLSQRVSLCEDIFDMMLKQSIFCNYVRTKYKYLSWENDYYIKQSLLRCYHRYLNGKPYDYYHMLDSINSSIAHYDSISTLNSTKDSIDGDYIPINVEDAVAWLQINAPKEMLDSAKSQDEDNFCNSQHLGYGMGLRNKFHLWGRSRFSKYFTNHKVMHPDSMSDIILTAFHRKMNGKDMDIEALIKAKQDK